MRREACLWSMLRRGMTTYWIAQRIEDRYSVGIPDLYYALRDGTGRGWLELKAFPALRRGRRIPAGVLSTCQRAWIEKFCRHGVVARVLLRVGRDYYLFDGRIAGAALADTPVVDLPSVALGHWRGRLDYAALAAALRDP